MGKKQKAMTDAVRDQYEDLPYPPRNPVDERKRLVTGSPSQVVEIDHYLYAGARDWAEPSACWWPAAAPATR